MARIGYFVLEAELRQECPLYRMRLKLEELSLKIDLEILKHRFPFASDIERFEDMRGRRLISWFRIV